MTALFNLRHSISAVAHDLRAAYSAALCEWRRCRWLRKFGGNPDTLPF